MLADAFAALQALAAHPRIDGRRIGITGFSKGGTVALLAAHEARAARALPAGLRFALHVPFYPWCGTQHYKPKMTGAPIYMLLGAADTYAGVAPCQRYAETLKAQGAPIEVVVYPGATHGFDGGRSYQCCPRPKLQPLRVRPTAGRQLDGNAQRHHHRRQQGSAHRGRNIAVPLPNAAPMA